MSRKLQMYKCEICGNVAELLVQGGGDLVCCGEKMRLLEPQNDVTNDELREKHSPEILREDNKTIVRLTEHPMIQEHYIMLVQAEDEEKGEIYIKFFNPYQQVEFELENKNITDAYTYCNVHELYKNKL